MAKRKCSLNARERSRQQAKRHSTLKYYPTMYCTEEKLYIGLSTMPMKMSGDRWGNISPKDKVNAKHWKVENCSFRSKEYIIDMLKHKDGDLIRCPRCFAPIDFRLFGSNTIPKMVDIDDKKINITKPPEA